jgi:ubiquinone/menaquinone biosynthesis C-methylase UbiE
MQPTDNKSQGFLGNFANVDQANPADLVGRLDTMHGLEFFRSYKKETFALMQLSPGSRAADVGCGTGEDARHMAELVGSTGGVVGFDVSEAMLKEARIRKGSSLPNLQFRHSSADDLKMEPDFFDAIRADRVLTHVPDTSGALREMVRVVKPGGRVIVSEPDMPGCWVTNQHHAITERIMKAIAQSCVHPYVARDMYHHFRDVGLVDIRLILRSVALVDPDPVEKILKFGAAMETMIAAGELCADEAALWLSEFNERRNCNRFLAGVTIFIVSGTKSARDQG